MHPGPVAPRATMTDSPDGLEVVMPAPRVWPVIIFLGLWLTGWATGEAFALRQVLSPMPVGGILFLAVWLAGWTLGGAVALSVCVWMLVGHERVKLRPDVLTIRREALGLGPGKHYALDRVTNLRAPVPPALPELAQAREAMSGKMSASPEAVARALQVVGIGGPGIVFDYGGKPVRFGVALDPTEARQVVAQLQGRHAFPENPAAA